MIRVLIINALHAYTSILPAVKANQPQSFRVKPTQEYSLIILCGLQRYVFTMDSPINEPCIYYTITYRQHAILVN